MRGGALRKKRCDLALDIFWHQVAASNYHIVPITSSSVKHAADLCSVHALGGYDAVQLACALAVRADARLADAMLTATGHTPLGDPIFLTEDTKLGAAAAREGFAVDSPLRHP